MRGCGRNQAGNLTDIAGVIQYHFPKWYIWHDIIWSVVLLGVIRYYDDILSQAQWVEVVCVWARITITPDALADQGQQWRPPTIQIPSLSIIIGSGDIIIYYICYMIIWSLDHFFARMSWLRLVSYPTRWSLLFIFGFLYGLSIYFVYFTIQATEKYSAAIY